LHEAQRRCIITEYNLIAALTIFQGLGASLCVFRSREERKTERESQTRTIEDVNIPTGDGMSCTANKISNELNLREKGSNVMLLNLYLERSAFFLSFFS
jgi:hypothetical protein